MLRTAFLLVGFCAVLAGQSITYPGFGSTTGLTLNGSAAPARTSDGIALRLTPPQCCQSGSAFSTTPINFQRQSDAFSTSFQFRITQPSSPPADGFVFAIQTEANNVGTGGGGLGFQGISPSIGVEFDTFQNDEPDGNHVAILINGDTDNDIALANPYGVTDCGSPLGTFGCLANGDLWTVWIDYDGAFLHIAVADNSTTRPEDLITYRVNIADTLDSSSAFVGFTAGTGTFWEAHDIVDWQFNNSYSPITAPPVPAPSGPAVPPPPQPVISGKTNLGDIALGSSVSATYTASSGSPPYRWAASQLPTGLAFSNGTLTGTPAAPGVYNFFVQVTDSAGQSSGIPATLSVFGISTAALPAAIAYTPYSGAIAGVGGVAPYTFAATGLPSGITISTSGALTGATTKTGTFPVNVTASDSGGVTISATLSLTVKQQAALSVSAVQLPAGTVGVAYSQAVKAASNGAPPYSWSFVAGAPPAGLTLNQYGVLAGTPAANGAFAFTARATDQSGASADTAISVSIAAPAVTIVTPSPLSQGMVTVDYPEQVLAATGGAPPYSFAVTTGTLPAGLTLNPLGTITGVPTTAGTSSFTSTVTDSAGATGSAPFQINVRAFGPDLMVAPGSLSFSVAAGQTTLPAPQSVQVQSSVVTTILNYSVSVTPAVAWLSVTPVSGSTPGAFTVTLNASVSSLTPSSVQTTITVTCTASVCAGKAQNIPVTLNVSSVPATLTAIPSVTSLSTPGAAQAQSGSFIVQNSGGGSLGIASITADASWVSIGAAPGSLLGGNAATVPFTADPSGLAPGFYRSDVTIRSSGGSAVIPVSLFISTGPSLALQPAGRQFRIAAGGVVGPSANTFLVDTSSATGVAWSANVVSNSPWLSIANPSGTSTLTQPASVSYTIDPQQVSALAPGAYYGRIEITSSAPVNSPLDFEVVLDVTASTVAQAPAPDPQGLLFITGVSANVPAQTVTVYANSPGAVAFQTSPSTSDGNSWLSVSPATGTATTGNPAQTQISVNTAGLSPGVYSGGVSYAFSTAGVRTVNVTLLVTASSTNASSSAASAKASAGCVPAQLVLAPTGPVSNFSAPAAWPTPISIQILDNCANVIGNAQVVTTFSNGDPPLVLSLADFNTGLYGGTWTPRKSAAQLSVKATATASGFPAASSQLNGAVTPNDAPLLNDGGILNSFLTNAGAGLAPGTIVQIYGSYLASQISQSTNIPLSQSLAGTSLLIGGIPAPLYYSSAGQINAQVPFELQPGHQYQVIANANGALSTPQTIQLTPASPGLAAFPSGTIIAQHADGSLVTESAPAKPGEYLVIYAAGFGSTNTAVSSGAASPSSPLAQPQNAPSLTLNSESVNIFFAGLTPGLVGLYQLNFQVPVDAPNGDLQLVLSQGGVAANTTILPVHN